MGLLVGMESSWLSCQALKHLLIPGNPESVWGLLPPQRPLLPGNTQEQVGESRGSSSWTPVVTVTPKSQKGVPQIGRFLSPMRTPPFLFIAGDLIYFKLI